MKFFRNISKLTSWLLFSRESRKKFKEYCTYLDLKEDIEKAHKNYSKVIERIKNKPAKEKIKVGFLIRENQKWTYQSVYETLEKSGRFEPVILISILGLVLKGKDKTRNNIEENYNFFKSKGMRVEYAFKDGEYTDLSEFNIVILFYDQPWDLPEIHMPLKVSEFALTYYSSYSYELVDNEEDYTPEFHRMLYKFFVEDELNILRYDSYIKGNGANCLAVGYPKLDEYFNNPKPCQIWKDKDKFKIIYAPHHSIEKNGIRLATFEQNGQFILELARNNPDTTWVFKPHPRLKYALLRTKTMSKEEVENYYNEWAKIGTIFEEGSYLDLFRSSDLMITDGCSFLAEYLPSKKPLIRPINKNGIKLNKVGEKISEGLYCTTTNKELEKIFYDIIKNNQDSKKEARINLADEVLNPKETSADKIYNEILKTLEIKK